MFLFIQIQNGVKWTEKLAFLTINGDVQIIFVYAPPILKWFVFGTVIEFSTRFRIFHFISEAFMYKKSQNAHIISIYVSELIMAILIEQFLLKNVYGYKWLLNVKWKKNAKTKFSSLYYFYKRFPKWAILPLPPPPKGWFEDLESVKNNFERFKIKMNTMKFLKFRFCISLFCTRTLTQKLLLSGISKI